MRLLCVAVMTDARPTDGEFAAFYAAEYAGVVHSVAVLTRLREEAEDVAQEAFLRALTRWRTLRDHQSPRAWLHLTATRIAVSRWRHWGARTNSSVAPAVVAPTPDLDTRAMLYFALKQLSPRQRQVVVLHYFSDLPIDEIALVLDQAPGTIKSLLHRARTRLEAEVER